MISLTPRVFFQSFLPAKKWGFFLSFIFFSKPHFPNKADPSKSKHFFSLKMWNPAINSSSWAENPRAFLTEKSVLREQMCCLTGRSTDETRVGGIWRGREKTHVYTPEDFRDSNTHSRVSTCVYSQECVKIGNTVPTWILASRQWANLRSFAIDQSASF